MNHPPCHQKCAKNKQDPDHQEGRALLAIQAIKNKEISSIRAAARIFSVPRRTLDLRLRGVQSRANSRANSHKMTEIEEDSLEKWTLSMDVRGSAPRPSMVREMADILLAKRGNGPIITVGKNWVTKFIDRHPNLASQFSKRYNYTRAKCEDPEIISEWFTKVQQNLLQYGIDPSDIYNFDETGFAMGVTATARVITRSEYYGKRAVLQPGDREWVTSLECINASGWVMPPCIIFKGKRYIAS
jgi:hypothetical protein